MARREEEEEEEEQQQIERLGIKDRLGLKTGRWLKKKGIDDILRI